MHKTMFDTWIIKDVFRLISMIFLKLTGWKVVGDFPRQKSFVLIAAPHTSNWDLPFLMAMTFTLRAKIYWMGKAQIFKPPFKGLMKWMGGIPVDRSKSNNLVEYSAELLKQNPGLIIAVPPEGTRSKVKHWKTGFYHIARLAETSILLGFLDYGKKEGGVISTFELSQDIDADMQQIQSIYAKVQGKYPSLYE